MMVKAVSRKQTITALSSAEAESALTEAAKEVSLLLETFLQGLPSGETGPYPSMYIYAYMYTYIHVVVFTLRQ